MRKTTTRKTKPVSVETTLTKNAPTNAVKRRMSMQSRRKQRSADQLLSRTGHAVPLTTPTSKPPQAPKNLSTPPPPSQYQPSQARAPPQPSPGGADDWGFGGGGDWGQNANSGQQQQQQHFGQTQQSHQQQTFTPRARSQSPTNTTQSQQHTQQYTQQQHRTQTATQQPPERDGTSTHKKIPYQNKTNLSNSPKPPQQQHSKSSSTFDSLFADEGQDSGAQTMGAMFGGSSNQSNPFSQPTPISTNPNSFRSKFQGGSIVAPKKLVSPDGKVSGEPVAPGVVKEVPKMVKAESIFAKKLTKNDDQNGQNFEHLSHDDEFADLDFNPLTQIREQFNKETGSNLPDPTDVDLLEKKKNKKTSKNTNPTLNPLGKRTVIHPGEEHYNVDDESYDDVNDTESDDTYGRNQRTKFENDPYATLQTSKLKKATQKTPEKFNEEITDDASDPEGYMELLRERAEEDAHFNKELEAYYQQFPSHRKLVHNSQNMDRFGSTFKQRLKQHEESVKEARKTLGIRDPEGFSQADQFKGQLSDDVESDFFGDNSEDFDQSGPNTRNTGGKRRGNGQNKLDDVEMPSDMEDFSAFGASLRGDFGEVDFTPAAFRTTDENGQLVDENGQKIENTAPPLSAARTKRLDQRKKRMERRLRKAELRNKYPNEEFSGDELSGIDEGGEGEGGEEDGDDNFPDFSEGEKQALLEQATKHRHFTPIGEDNAFEIDGVRIPLRGLKKKDMEDFMRENEKYEQLEQSEEEEAKEHFQSIGFTKEELDADKPKRIDYYKLPTSDQIPLVDTNLLEFKDTQSILNWDVPWPEHTSTCDLSIRTCILGTPNAGKSVIVNNLTRTRVTAVSAKRNTTRRRVLGISSEGNAQLTLYDTPGINEIHDAKKFQRDLATEAWDSVGDADLALVVIDAAKRIGGPELFLLHKCSDVKTSSPHIRWVLALNKVDLVDPKDRLLDILYRIQTLMPFDDCFMISGLDGDGMADLEHYLYQQAIPREWEHERDEKTDQSDVQLAGELIRETLYHRLNKEIPYTVQQENVEWMPLKNGQLRIDQRLIVRRDQHKRILVGSNGSALRAITKAAEDRLRTAFRRPVSLNLRVSVSVTQDFDV